MRTLAIRQFRIGPNSEVGASVKTARLIIYQSLG